MLEQNISSDPFQQFASWLQEAINAELLDATAMTLATVDQQGWPDTRVVLLKDFSPQGFVFFTHYDSPKALQIQHLPIVALNFYWREFARQVRVRGKIEFTSREESKHYFAERPHASQISALASHQSEIIANREEIENCVSTLTKTYAEKTIPCPDNWGGYRIIPFEFEFFQGRDNRLNDRIRYLLQDEKWEIARLSP